jgi:hypothetical protein
VENLKEAPQNEARKQDTLLDSNNLAAQSARSACRRTVEAMTSDERERIKRCIAWFLCPEPSALQAEILYSILDALEHAHLAELDGRIHNYETDEKSNI